VNMTGGGADDSFVLVGGRKNLPKLHVVNEENNNVSLRHRASTSTPDSEHDYSLRSLGTPANRTPVHSSPVSLTRIKIGASPSLDDLKQGVWGSRDSGYGPGGRDTGYGPDGRSDSQTARKNLKFDSTYVLETSLWESFSTPIFNLKAKLKGRQSFLDESPRPFSKNVQPQHILAGVVLLVMLSSICFGVFIGLNQFGDQLANGKLKSIKYGTERKLEKLKEAGKLLDRDIVDEKGLPLGGKRASIQYAFENDVKVDDAVVAGAAPKPSVAPEAAPRQGAASLTKEKAKASDHLDLVELSESIDKLMRLMEGREAREQELLERAKEVFQEEVGGGGDIPRPKEEQLAKSDFKRSTGSDASNLGLNFEEIIRVADDEETFNVRTKRDKDDRFRFKDDQFRFASLDDNPVKDGWFRLTEDTADDLRAKREAAGEDMFRYAEDSVSQHRSKRDGAGADGGGSNADFRLSDDSSLSEDDPRERTARTKRDGGEDEKFRFN